MSRSWHGGKGSDNRVSNHRAYWDSPLWKNKGMNTLHISEDIEYIDPIEEEIPMTSNKKFLFLDDIRIPQTAYLWDENQTLLERSGIRSDKWDIVRDYNQFVDYINTQGIPDVVSFDNDLWDVASGMNTSPDNEDLVKQFQMKDWENFEIKTGAHCAQYLVQKCKEQGCDIPKYYVHSANKAARPIIRKIMEDSRI